MPSLKDLRNRISSVKATQKITKAMQMVAAAKLRRAQEAVVASRPYADHMNAVMSNIAKTMADREDAPPLFAGTGSNQTHLLLVCTAERGLCGGFNSSIAKLAKEHANKLLSEGREVKILCVGKKGYDSLRREMGGNILDTVVLRDVKQIEFKHADSIGSRVRQMFEKGEFDVCTLFYSQFRSVISQVPTSKQLIPYSFVDKPIEELIKFLENQQKPDSIFIEELREWINKEDMKNNIKIAKNGKNAKNLVPIEMIKKLGICAVNQQKPDPALIKEFREWISVQYNSYYECEPDEEIIMEELLPLNLSVQIFRGLLENAAGEMGAKMTAMDNATRNAGEMIDKLTISYNRQRQAQITKELIEIISGAEAL